MKKQLLLITLLILAKTYGFAQDIQQQAFSRADSLRGNLTALRNCYDINYYHLDVKVDNDQKYISGSNLFKFTATEDFSRLQFDLFENLEIDKVEFQGKPLNFKREFNAVFVDFPQVIKKGSSEQFTVYYKGNPVIAKNAPWDGGFVFSKDKSGKPWVAVACQGFGASSWWPTKDHQSDEVDSMLISVAVPPGLTDVSNGRLRSSKKMADGFTQFNWFVSYPINNYTVSVNIADYAHFSDTFAGENGNLDLDFYVLQENLEKAKIHFNADVKPMLTCFENWFGPYPFYRDGYKLIETPYLGMEHQSAVAYGNNYLKGYRGRDLSGTGLGMTWDFIIVHESGHEWFGNNITSKDIADMWMHEAFTMYSEGLFVECKNGKEAGTKYIEGVRQSIRNDKPIIGPYHVNTEGSGDMYYKGANMLQTIRSVINDDVKWKQILRGLNSEFGLKTSESKDIENYIIEKSGIKLQPIFDQYLRTTKIPVLNYKISGKKLSYKWDNVIDGFDMPVLIKAGNKDILLHPGQQIKTERINSNSISISNGFYVNSKKETR
ncbi:M1 family metallopeptidase [Daejeonella oryzae]|uniref:M1 family metallopeptidase n=1 Tax=Daejeonella oryzae TaxID=1122943 RepID=UPI00042967C4|nr:M1 family metallopeptidase [Daejeonella oryzae]